MGQLLSTPSRYVALEVVNAKLLRSFVSPTPCIAPPKWRRLIIKKFVRYENSNVCGTMLPLRLSFSPYDDTSTLCMYLDVSKSSTGDKEFIMAVIDGLLSLDATIMLDDLHVEGSYAPLVVELLPTLLGDERLLRLQGLPAVYSVACTLLSLGVKLPAALVLDLSSPKAIDIFLSWLPWILASIPDERYTRRLQVHLCFEYNALLRTQDRMRWSNINNILTADHPLALLVITSLDMPDSILAPLLSVLLPGAQGRLDRHCWPDSAPSTH
ncbi:hypothetical protein CPB85DRAFT_98055 [Mucidula mucida]|nr:hypothetical protein CPB85DRAFT_98055 [Mucidula mucida]